MGDPMRIRATEQPDGVDVRVLMSHEMETGSGVIRPATSYPRTTYPLSR